MKPLTFAAAGAALVAIAVAGGLYGERLLGNSGGTCKASAELGLTLQPLAIGEVAAFKVAPDAVPVPDLAFKKADGSPLGLADFKGRTVLVNLWATWCEPCKREMPALDTLQGDLGGPRFEVVTINLDTRNLDRPRKWLDEAGVTRLAYYGDSTAKVFQDLRRAGWTDGLPTTILVGPDGCRIGQLSGWAEWASAEGHRLVKAAIPSG